MGLLAVGGVLVGVLAYAESPLLRAEFDGFFAISYGVGSLWTAVIGWVITAAGFPAAFAVMVAFARDSGGAPGSRAEATPPTF